MPQELVPKEKQEVQGREQTRPGRFYIPAVDIWEDDDGLTLRADMPGVDAEHVSVELNDNVLSLQGEVALSDYEGLTPVYTEYNVGHFQRFFTIPSGDRYDRGRVQARLSDGVLEVTIPRAEKAKPRHISVSAG
jgi:HSP20 family molecular chaperone IbpA